MDEILKAVGAFVLAGGGLTAIVYGAFKFFAQKWLESKFSERLALLKHDQDKEIEQLRLKINTLLDRATKFHQREYEVLPEVWALLNEAFWTTSAFVSPFQRYPDLNKMTATQLQEFLNSSSLENWEKEEIIGAKDRSESYIERIFWHTLQSTNKTAREFNIYLLKNGIFLQPELREKFQTINDLIWKALGEIESNKRYQVFPLDFSKRDEFLEGGPERLQELELLVQARLWSTEQSAL